MDGWIDGCMDGWMDPSHLTARCLGFHPTQYRTAYIVGLVGLVQNRVLKTSLSPVLWFISMGYKQITLQ